MNFRTPPLSPLERPLAVITWLSHGTSVAADLVSDNAVVVLSVFHSADVVGSLFLTACCEGDPVADDDEEELGSWEDPFDGLSESNPGITDHYNIIIYM